MLPAEPATFFLRLNLLQTDGAVQPAMQMAVGGHGIDNVGVCRGQ
jgi:hypothetical protein